jgi:membrane fusion protein (multidrug efflux system)
MKSIIPTLIAAVTMAAGCEKPAPPAAPPPTEVVVAPVTQKDVPVYLELVGQTVGFQDVEIRARVEGILESMAFQEGSFVRQGQPLYRIDRKPLEATVAAARADQATAEARMHKADNDVKRYTPLAAKQAVSQQELDNARAALDAARSEVEAAKAAVEKATLDLGYTVITSPIDGLIGTTLVKPGNLVGRGENTLLATISQINPILFRVGVTEADYLRIVRRTSGRGTGRAGIELTLADGTLHPTTGTISTVDRAVDPATGTLGVQFQFANPNQVLRPGQFGRAKILVDMKSAALLIPQRAVQEVQNLYTVAVVGPDRKVAFRNVTVGQRMDTDWVIEKGLQPGEQVVVEGLQRIQDGMQVATREMSASDSVATAGDAGTASGSVNGKAK